MNTPYTLKVVPSGSLQPPIYMILYEGSVIRKVSGVEEKDVRDIVFLFNTAYDEGFCEGYRQGKFDVTPV